MILDSLLINSIKFQKLLYLIQLVFAIKMILEDLTTYTVSSLDLIVFIIINCIFTFTNFHFNTVGISIMLGIMLLYMYKEINFADIVILFSNTLTLSSAPLCLLSYIEITSLILILASALYRRYQRQIMPAIPVIVGTYMLQRLYILQGL